MNNKTKAMAGILVFGLVLIMALSTIWINTAEAKDRVIWEYKTEIISPVFDSSKNDSQLNEYGKDGWELVATHPYANDSALATYRFQFIFKRPKNGNK